MSLYYANNVAYNGFHFALEESPNTKTFNIVDVIYI